MVMVRAAISHFLHRTGVHRATRTYGYVILKIPTRRVFYKTEEDVKYLRACSSLLTTLKQHLGGNFYIANRKSETGTFPNLQRK